MARRRTAPPCRAPPTGSPRSGVSSLPLWSRTRPSRGRTGLLGGVALDGSGNTDFFLHEYFFRSPPPQKKGCGRKALGAGCSSQAAKQPSWEPDKWCPRRQAFWQELRNQGVHCSRILTFGALVRLVCLAVATSQRLVGKRSYIEMVDSTCAHVCAQQIQVASSVAEWAR
jgi:hypothetical protein